MKTIEDIRLLLFNSDYESLKEARDDYDINSIDSSGNNILHFYLLQYKSINIEWKLVLDLFISKKIDINAKQLKGGFKRSPLHIAVLQNQKEIANYLISLGAEIDSTDANGNTILSTAVMWWDRIDDDYFVKTLIEKGANINQENNHGRSPKMSALENDGNEEIHKYFI